MQEFLPYFPLIVTIIGWWVANSASAARDIRKERRCEVDEFSNLALETYKKLHSFYLIGGDSPQSASVRREIIFDFSRLIDKAERLEIRCPKFQIAGSVSEYWETATDGDFESKERKAEFEDSGRLSSIQVRVQHLLQNLEAGFDNQFKS